MAFITQKTCTITISIFYGVTREPGDYKKTEKWKAILKKNLVLNPGPSNHIALSI